MFLVGDTQEGLVDFRVVLFREVVAHLPDDCGDVADGVVGVQGDTGDVAERDIFEAGLRLLDRSEDTAQLGNGALEVGGLQRSGDVHVGALLLNKGRDLVERRVTGRDGGALDTVRAGGEGSSRAGDAHAHLVGDLDIEFDVLHLGDVLFETGHEGRELVRQEDACGIAQGDAVGTGGDGSLHGFIEEVGLGAGGVDRGELDVLAEEAAEFDLILDEFQHGRGFFMAGVLHLHGRNRNKEV